MHKQFYKYKVRYLPTLQCEHCQRNACNGYTGHEWENVSDYDTYRPSHLPSKAQEAKKGGQWK